MATLSSDRLLDIITAATGSTAIRSEVAPKPVFLNIPDLGKVRIYLWTTTPDKSVHGRPEGEHKSQIILPGTPRGSRQHLTIDSTPTFLLGYSPLYGVFVSWEAHRHQNSGYSKNLQVKEELLEEASRNGWAISTPRRTEKGPEVRASVHPSHLRRFLEVSIIADSRSLQGEERSAFLSAHAPYMGTLDMKSKIDSDDISLSEIQRERIDAIQSRLKRDSRFSKIVLNQYNYRCAICKAQLNMLDGAHIIPVHDSRSTDDIWNGLALCKNHHHLFDKRIILIDAETTVRADEEAIDILRSLDRLDGYQEVIGLFRNRKLQQLPNFFDTDKSCTQKMKQALMINYSMTFAA